MEYIPQTIFDQKNVKKMIYRKINKNQFVKRWEIWAIIVSESLFVVSRGSSNVGGIPDPS